MKGEYAMGREDLLVRRIEMIRRIVDRSRDIGKTKVQKITYFLQESLGVPLMYPFRMHYYGPYSDDLDGALSLTKSLGYIDIKPDLNGFGYHVTPTNESKGASWQGYDMSNDSAIPENVEDEAIDRAIDILRQLETPKLELYATVHFIGSPSGKFSKSQTLETVSRLKPKFTKSQIDDAYLTLDRAGLI